MAKGATTAIPVDPDREHRIFAMFVRRCARDIAAEHTNAGFVRSRAQDIENAADDYLREHGGGNV